MRKILVALLLASVFAIPGFAEAGGNKHLLKKMTKPPLKEKIAQCLHPCKCNCK
ncbi:MAG: hypothetical protein ACLQNE_03985 [Thermoguttaceae bacterium]